jgi:hypothetical protein
MPPFWDAAAPARPYRTRCSAMGMEELVRRPPASLAASSSFASLAFYVSLSFVLTV